MRLLLDYNPLTGERVWFGSDSSNTKVTITHEQDVDYHLRRAHSQAVDDDQTKRGISKDFWKYASVPNIVIMEMKSKHGVDFFDKNDWPKVLELLNGDYSRFKTTSKVHRERRR